MDWKLNILKEFYNGLPMNKAKIETNEHGFNFLTQLLVGGATLEYGELTLSGLLHKYKIVDIPNHRMDEFLKSHISKECNVCLYFDTRANNMFCFNMDNNHKTNNTIVIPEMDLAVRAIRNQLIELGCEPLIIASGRGYHVWCRFDVAIDNNLLYQFMLRVAAKTMATLHKKGYDYHKIKFNFYPDTRIYKVVSLRLFGSEHAKNKAFSYVFTPNQLLDEAASWEYFEAYIRNKIIPEDKFAEAYAAIMTSLKVFKGVPTLETDSLILRKISIDDIEFIYHHMKNEKVRKFFEKFWPKDREGIEEFVRGAIQRNENDQSAEWVIVLKREKKVVGRIWLEGLLSWCNAVNVGYSIDHNYWGLGVASEALNRVIQFGFDKMHLKRIEAWHDSINKASGKVMLKCGLILEGVLRDRGDDGNAEMYSILQQDYLDNKE